MVIFEVSESTLVFLRRLALSSYFAWCMVIFAGCVLGIAFEIVTSTWGMIKEGWRETMDSLSREAFCREEKRCTWEGRHYLNEGRRL